jgi:hypothetical protein
MHLHSYLYIDTNRYLVYCDTHPDTDWTSSNTDRSALEKAIVKTA